MLPHSPMIEGPHKAQVLNWEPLGSSPTEGLQLCSAEAVNSKGTWHSYYKQNVTESRGLFLPLLFCSLPDSSGKP